MENIIEVKNMSKIFGDNIALNNLNFAVKKGEIFGFLGPSGAGKTTTIKLLTSQLKPTKGECYIFDQRIDNVDKYLFNRIGVLSDTSSLYERMTLEENLVIFAKFYNIDKSNVESILKSVNLYEHRKQITSKLSKGMKQRLNLARALIHEPDVLFLDEPTSSLDPGVTKKIHTILLALKNSGTTIFLTTHNMDEADKLCDKVAFLDEGEIIEMDSPDNLKEKYADSLVAVKLLPNRLVKHVQKDIEGIRQILKWTEEEKVISIHSVEPNLEEVFLRLTGRNL